MVFIAVFLSLYILILGPPLLLYTLVTRHIDPLYWAGLKGVMFFVRAVGVRVRVEGKANIPEGVCLFVANHTSSADAPAVVGAIPRRIAVLLKESLFKWPIVGQAFTLARFYSSEPGRSGISDRERRKGGGGDAGRAVVSDLSGRNPQPRWTTAGVQEGRGCVGD